jgi:hypothetical protein
MRSDPNYPGVTNDEYGRTQDDCTIILPVQGQIASNGVFYFGDGFKNKAGSRPKTPSPIP